MATNYYLMDHWTIGGDEGVRNEKKKAFLCRTELD